MGVSHRAHRRRCEGRRVHDIYSRTVVGGVAVRRAGIGWRSTVWGWKNGLGQSVLRA